jgi:hypothetical protein
MDVVLPYRTIDLRPPRCPSGMVERALGGGVSYRFLPGESFHRDDLVAVAHANGYRLSPEMLRMLRRWRFLPGPVAGGKTGKGPGKGETWGTGAMWRVAWLARWRGFGFTYDELRLALWLWTPVFDSERLPDVGESVCKFARQYEAFHWTAFQLTGDEDGSSVLDENYPRGTAERAYIDHFLYENSDQRRMKQMLRLEMPDATDVQHDYYLPFVKKLSFWNIAQELKTVDTALLARFIQRFRGAAAPHQAMLVADFWNQPRSVASILVRELYHCALLERGKLVQPLVSGGG